MRRLHQLNITPQIGRRAMQVRIICFLEAWHQFFQISSIFFISNHTVVQLNHYKSLGCRQRAFKNLALEILASKDCAPISSSGRFFLLCTYHQVPTTFWLLIMQYIFLWWDRNVVTVFERLGWRLGTSFHQLWSTLWSILVLSNPLHQNWIAPLTTDI